MWTKRKWKLFPFLVLFVVTQIQADSETATLQTCEGDLAQLECPENRQIQPFIANFGRYSLTPCNPETNLELKTNCSNNQTLQVLSELCGGKQQCSVSANKDVFGDLCPGTPKYLEIQYRCVEITTTAPPTTTETIPTTNPIDEIIVPPMNPPSVDESQLLLPKDYCLAEYYHFIQWPKIRKGSLARAVCSGNSQGVATRSCGDSGQWSEFSDLTECVSDTIDKFKKDNDHFFKENAMVPLFVSQELSYADVRIAGDLVEISKISERIQQFNGKNELPINRDELQETSKNTLKLLNNLLQPSEREHWLDLSPEAQRSVAHRLFTAAQNSLKNIAKSLAASDVFRAPILARPLVQGAVAVIKHHSSVEMPQQNSLEQKDRVLFQLIDEMEKMADDFELTYTSISSLAPFLINQPLHQRECRRNIVSNIISTSATRRSNSKPLKDVPLILSFATKRSVSLPFHQCTKFNEEMEDFVFDGSCEMLVNNETNTICKCYGGGHYAVMASTCQVQTIFFGLNPETVALYASIIFAIIGLSVFIFGLSLHDTKRPTLIPKHFTVTLIVTQLLLSIWYALPKTSWLYVVIVYSIQLTTLMTVCWGLCQVGLLAYTMIKVFGNESSGKKKNGLYYLVGYAIPTLLAALVLLFCGNFQNALQGRQTLLPPQLYTSLTLLFIIIAFHVLAIMVTVTILCKHRRVGYEPCRNDNGKVKQVKHTLEIVVPLIVISDVFLLSLTMFVAKWTVQWIWAIIIINLIIAAWTIKVGLWANTFCNKSKLNASQLPKDSVFSPALHPRGSVPNILDPHYSTKAKTNAVVQYYEDGPKTMVVPDFHALHQQMYVPTKGGVHDHHYCDHTYATISPEYNAFYGQHCYHEQGHFHQDHPHYLHHVHPAQLPSFPPPPAPDGYGHLQGPEHHQSQIGYHGDHQGHQNQMGYPVEHQQEIGYAGDHQHTMNSAYFQHRGPCVQCPVPICNEHGPRCPSLVGIRTPQLQHRPSSASTSNASSSGSPYESARSSSTTATTSQISTNSRGALLRMDMTRNMPVFLDDEQLYGS